MNLDKVVKITKDEDFEKVSFGNLVEVRGVIGPYIGHYGQFGSAKKFPAILQYNGRKEKDNIMFIKIIGSLNFEENGWSTGFTSEKGKDPMFETYKNILDASGYEKAIEEYKTSGMGGVTA